MTNDLILWISAIIGLVAVFLIFAYIKATDEAKKYYKSVDNWLVIKEWWSIEKLGGRYWEYTIKKFNKLQNKNHPFDRLLWYTIAIPVRVLLGLLLVLFYLSFC